MVLGMDLIRIPMRMKFPDGTDEAFATLPADGSGGVRAW